MTVTEANLRQLDTGLRILARMIARAHLREKHKTPETSVQLQEKETEESDVNKGRI